MWDGLRNFFRAGVAFAVLLAIAGSIALAWLLPDDRSQLTVGYQPNLIYLPVFVADEKGYFREQGLDVKLIKFASAPEMMESLRGGAIDLTGMTSLEVIAREAARSAEGDAGATGSKIIVLEGFSPTPSPDAILVGNSYPSRDLSGLRGARIGVWQGTTIKAYTKLILAKFNITENDISIIPLGKAEQLQLLSSGTIDSIFTFEPTVSVAARKGIAKVLETAPLAKHLFSTPRVIYPGGSAVLAEFAGKHRNAISKYQLAYLKAAAYCRENWNHCMSILASKTGAEPGDVEGLSRMDWTAFTADLTNDVDDLLGLFEQEKITEKRIRAKDLLIE